jgi:hypothetical protein
MELTAASVDMTKFGDFNLEEISQSVVKVVIGSDNIGSRTETSTAQVYRHSLVVFPTGANFSPGFDNLHQYIKKR